MNTYLIERDFGKLGTEIIGYPEYTKRKVIDLIAKGEWPELVKVLEINEADGTCRNVTEDMARDVLAQTIEEDFGRMSDDVRGFIENQIGCAEFAEATREYAGAQA